MLRSLANSAAGMDAHGKRVDVISHNIANINTVGYKKQDISFAELFYQELAKPGNAANPNPPNQRPIMEGSGVKVSATGRDWRQGTIMETGQTFDFAIQGQGFFEIELPDGTLAYTRSGAFKADEDGWLINNQGYFLTAPVEIWPEYGDIAVSSQGLITGQNPQGEIEDLGYIPLYNFTNPGGLEAIGENLFIATEAAGELWEGIPGEDGLGVIRQGFLESANVFLAEEITDLIEAQRAYQMNSRALQAADEMWSMANNLKR